jgi:hypothetical protein
VNKGNQKGRGLVLEAPRHVLYYDALDELEYQVDQQDYHQHRYDQTQRVPRHPHLPSPRHQPVRRSITEEPNPCSRLHPLAARSYSPLPGRAEGVSQSAGNCVEHEDGRAAGGSAALQMWCGAILRYDSPPSTPQFVRTSRLVKAS